MISRRREWSTLSTVSEGSSKLRIENVHETYHMNFYVRMGAEDTLGWSRLRELVDGKKPESKYRKFFYIHVYLSLYVYIIYSQSAFTSHCNHCFFRGDFPDQLTLTFISPPSPVSPWPWSKAREICPFFFFHVIILSTSFSLTAYVNSLKVGSGSTIVPHCILRT